MKVSVEADKCVAVGKCAVLAPAVFDQREEDGVVVLLRNDVENGLEPAVRKAAKLCPARAIRVEEV